MTLETITFFPRMKEPYTLRLFKVVKRQSNVIQIQNLVFDSDMDGTFKFVIRCTPDSPNKMEDIELVFSETETSFPTMQLDLVKYNLEFHIIPEFGFIGASYRGILEYTTIEPVTLEG